MMFEAEHEVVGIAHDDNVTVTISPPPLLRPQVEHVVQRPLGIAAMEDKILQRAVVSVMNAIYECDFRGFSVRLSARTWGA